MFFKILILCSVFFGISESAIWNIPKEFATKNSTTWCYPKGGKWDIETKECVCYKNYYGKSCEVIKNCQFGSKINNECLCWKFWKGDACDEIFCEYGFAINNKTCVCNPGIGGMYCDSCLQRYRSPPNCFETVNYNNYNKTNNNLNEQKYRPNLNQQQCSSNLINYYLNIFLFLLIAIYFTINRILKRREQRMFEADSIRPILMPDMEAAALLLAKTHMDPDFIPCPRYDEIITLHSSSESSPSSQSRITESDNEVRIISLHV